MIHARRRGLDDIPIVIPTSGGRRCIRSTNVTKDLSNRDVAVVTFVSLRRRTDAVHAEGAMAVGSFDRAAGRGGGQSDECVI